jgi:hypothetical protein
MVSKSPAHPTSTEEEIGRSQRTRRRLLRSKPQITGGSPAPRKRLSIKSETPNRRGPTANCCSTYCVYNQAIYRAAKSPTGKLLLKMVKGDVDRHLQSPACTAHLWEWGKGAAQTETSLQATKFAKHVGVTQT